MKFNTNALKKDVNLIVRGNKINHYDEIKTIVNKYSKDQKTIENKASSFIRTDNRMEYTKMLTDEELAKELAKMTPEERAQAMAYVMGLVAGKAQARRGLHSRQMERAGDVERKDEL